MIAIRRSVTAFHWHRGAGSSLDLLKGHHHEPSVSYSTRNGPGPSIRGRMVMRRRLAKRLEDENATVGSARVSGPKIVPAATYKDMDDLCLVTLGGMGNLHAREEILKRHIVDTDSVSYESACEIFDKIEEKNYEWMHFMALPFQVGIVTSFSAGLISIPLVFHLKTVEYCNEHFVTADHPPLKELETSLEVASWSWNWMEPVMGTATFVLLCLQYMRMHLYHLGVQPYTAQMKKIRARRLSSTFPQYSEELLVAYSMSSPFYDPKKLWI